MMFPLPVMTLDTKNTKVLNKIQRKAIQAILNKLGVNKSFPQCVAFGPKDMCGMALLDMSVEQGVHAWNSTFHGSCFLKRLSREHDVDSTLVSLQLESGCGFHLLENPSKWVPYIMPCWLTCIWDFLNKSKIKIKVASAWCIHTSQEHDCYVMDEIQKLGVYDDSQLFDINAVWLYLQVTTLSDIADAKGKQISEEAYKGTKLSDWYSTLEWPRQLVLMMKQWNLWKAALEAAFTSSGVVLKSHSAHGLADPPRLGGTSTILEWSGSSPPQPVQKHASPNIWYTNKLNIMWIQCHFLLHPRMCLSRRSIGTLWFQPMWRKLEPKMWQLLTTHMPRRYQMMMTMLLLLVITSRLFLNIFSGC